MDDLWAESLLGKKVSYFTKGFVQECLLICHTLWTNKAHQNELFHPAKNFIASNTSGQSHFCCRKCTKECWSSQIIMAKGWLVVFFSWLSLSTTAWNELHLYFSPSLNSFLLYNCVLILWNSQWQILLLIELSGQAVRSKIQMGNKGRQRQGTQDGMEIKSSKLDSILELRVNVVYHYIHWTMDRIIYCKLIKLILINN